MKLEEFTTEGNKIVSEDFIDLTSFSLGVRQIEMPNVDTDVLFRFFKGAK